MSDELRQDPLNGAAIDGIAVPIQVGHPDVIRVLQDALELAVKGQIAGVVIVKAHGGEGISSSAAGGPPTALITGMEQVKLSLLGNIFSPKRRSGLVVPGR